MIDLSKAIITPVCNPEAQILRSQEVASAKDGRLPPTDCHHPVHAMTQFFDEEKGREAKPINLFQCKICMRVLFLVDGFGKAASDG